MDEAVPHPADALAERLRAGWVDKSMSRRGTRRGTREGNGRASPRPRRPKKAEPLVARVVDSLRSEGIRVGTGRFGAWMEVELAKRQTGDNHPRHEADRLRHTGRRMSRRPEIPRDRCYPSITTFHLLGEMGAVRAHSF